MVSCGMEEEESLSWLDELNEAQRTAVLEGEGACLLMAGAGSGKTRTLTYRLAYLLSKGMEPSRVLTLTFTNKAAKEMRSRVARLLGDERMRSLWMGTFHSVFARILRIEHEVLGYTPHFSIYDTEDSKRLVKQILKEMSLDEAHYKVHSVLYRISSAKNSLTSWQQYAQQARLLREDERSQRPKMAEVYKEYVRRCYTADAMDFDDLLFNMHVLFQASPQALQKYQQRFEHVLVDEFQDTNVSQYLIIRKLSALRENLYVVGDDAQSIYAFRGANIENILSFKKDYPEAKLFRLEQNYRSTPEIVKASNSLIRHNKHQLEKTLWTDNPAGAKVLLHGCLSDIDEGRWIAHNIFEEKAQRHHHNADIAVLYRTNAQSRAIEEALRRAGLKYRIYGGLSFYQRKEVKDLLAYLSLTVNPNNEQALRRIINYPKRGIGDSSLQKLTVLAHEKNVSLWQALEQASQALSTRALNPINDFVAMIKSFRSLLDKEDAYALSYRIAKESGLMQELYQDKTTEGLSRYENLKELINSVHAFVHREDVGAEDTQLSAFLQEVSLLTDLDQEQEDSDRITLMTVHMAKGLEFGVVFVAGMEEDLFPSYLSAHSPEDLEEERRLLYVAMTRAKQKLFLSFAQSRYRFGEMKHPEPSRFLKDMDPKYLQLPATTSQRTHTAPPSMQYHPFPSQRIYRTSPLDNPPRTYPKTGEKSQPAPTNLSEIQVGTRVRHPTFGEGIVQEVANEKPHGPKAVVHFAKFGKKNLLLSFAKLHILP